MAYTHLTCITPIDDSVYLERPYAEFLEMQEAMARAVRAQGDWAALLPAERAVLLHAGLDRLEDQAAQIGEELVWQTGRPSSRAAGEVRRAVAFGRDLIARGKQLLAGEMDAESGHACLHRPRGPTLILPPAEYPLLVSIGPLFGALLAGNCVILKPSRQAPLVAERYAEALAVAGMPEWVYQPLNVNRQNVLMMVRDERIAQVIQIGGPAGAHALRRATAEGKAGFITVDPGWDAAYVAPGADIAFAASALSEAAFRNSGQGLGAVKRILLSPDIQDRFLTVFTEHSLAMVLGDPRAAETSLGPMIRKEQAGTSREILIDAFDRNARPLIDPRQFPRDRFGSAYCAPQAMLGMTRAMRISSEYAPGPLVGIALADGVEAAAPYLDGARNLLLFGGDAALARDFALAARIGQVRLDRADLPDPVDAELLFAAVSRRVGLDLERA